MNHHAGFRLVPMIVGLAISTGALATVWRYDINCNSCAGIWNVNTSRICYYGQTAQPCPDFVANDVNYSYVLSGSTSGGATANGCANGSVTIRRGSCDGGICKYNQNSYVCLSTCLTGEACKQTIQ